MTWAIAQVTQFVWPPRPTNPGGWKYEDSATGYLQGNETDGAYDTWIRSGGTGWSTLIETTAGATLVTKSATPGACFGLVALPNPIRLGERMAKTVRMAFVRDDARTLQKFMIVKRIKLNRMGPSSAVS